MTKRIKLSSLGLRSCYPMLIVGGVLIAGCHGDPYWNSYTRQKPKVADLTGTYVLTEQTLNDQSVTNLRTQAGSTAPSPTLTIRSNGTFAATNIPQWSNATESGYWIIKSFKSGSGTWELSNGWRDNSWALSLPSRNIGLPHMNLLGEQPPYKVLLNLADDPDQDEAMTFEKQSS